MTLQTKSEQASVSCQLWNLRHGEREGGLKLWGGVSESASLDRDLKSEFPKELTRTHFQCLGDPNEVVDRDGFCATFHRTHVHGMEIGLFRQLLLA